MNPSDKSIIGTWPMLSLQLTQALILVMPLSLTFTLGVKVTNVKKDVICMIRSSE
jgi:hypothetical protein